MLHSAVSISIMVCDPVLMPILGFQGDRNRDQLNKEVLNAMFVAEI